MMRWRWVIGTHGGQLQFFVFTGRGLESGLLLFCMAYCLVLPAELASGPAFVPAGLGRSERFSFALLLQMLGISTEVVHDS